MPLTVVITFAFTLCGMASGQLDLCVDHINNCEGYGVSICNGTYEKWAHLNCRNFCGYCSNIVVPTIGPPAPTPGTCKDKIQTCSQYGKAACQGQFMTWARQNCADYCGFCQSTGGSLIQQGGCLYKNKAYKMGQTWDDGCLYRCTCLDSQTGYYRCQSRCPTYTNLPENCTVSSPVAGECCGKIVCSDPNLVLHTVLPKPDNTTLPPALAGCTYKGVEHKTGDRWNVGCDFKCVCEDGSIGYYTCTTRCITWNLPSKCHLEEPAAGKCCRTPSCPAGYHISYPPGYQEE